MTYFLSFFSSAEILVVLDVVPPIRISKFDPAIEKVLEEKNQSTATNKSMDGMLLPELVFTQCLVNTNEKALIYFD